MPEKNRVFVLYKYGIPWAEIELENRELLSRRRDIHTGRWSEPCPFREDDAVFSEFPIRKLARHLGDLEAFPWEGRAEAKLGYGALFHRYCEICDGKDSSTIWVERRAKNPVDIVLFSGKLIGFVTMRRDGCLMLIEKGRERLTPLKAYRDEALSPANHDVKCAGTLQVPMRDGVKLASELYLPSGLRQGERVPTILLRTPYGRIASAEPELRFVFRGYALVAQDCRGRGDSEGEWVPNIHECEDGSDTLDWIAEQEWSDGQVGMIGGSYGGYVQWAAAASGNPHLKAIVSLVTSGSPFIDNPRKGGALMSGILAWCMLVSEKISNPEAMMRTDWEEVITHRPVKEIPEKVLGRSIPFWDEWLRHSDNDAFWQKADWTLHNHRIDVPSLIVSGWFDDDGQGSSQAWDMMKKQGGSVCRMILGPWYHKANTTRDIHNVPFGDNAILYDMDIIYLRWFDHYLKEIWNGIDREAAVRYYLVGDNVWKEADTWPPERTRLVPLYFREKGSLSFDVPGKGEKPDRYTFDPNDPAPHVIDISENELNVPENYSEVEKRSDILLYTTETLEEDIAIAGDLYATLHAASSGKDTDWIVRVTDVDTQGNSIRIAGGILRARYRNGFDKAEFISPGKAEKYMLRLTRVGHVFKRGHKIRVQVTSGAKNLAFPNCNTGEDPAFAVKFVTAEQTIYHQKGCESFIELPILE
ncbi:MAG: hydrolase [Dethiosulfovibrio peptidovorans]|nr:MAG: hydrolase [Dethiosulfovibrio peptidovorans]